MKNTINIRWSCNKRVYSFVQVSLLLVKPQLNPGLVRPPPEVKIICITQRGETRAKLVNVGSTQGVNAY